MVFHLRPSNKAARRQNVVRVGPWSHIWKNFVPKIENQNNAYPVFQKQRSGSQRLRSTRPVTKEFYLEVLGRLLKWTARMRSQVWKNCIFNLLHNNVTVHNTVTIAHQFWVKKKKLHRLATQHTLLIRALWTTLRPPNWKLNLKATNTKIFQRSRSLWQWNWRQYLLMSERKQWNDLKIVLKSIFS